MGGGGMNRENALLIGHWPALVCPIHSRSARNEDAERLKMNESGEATTSGNPATPNECTIIKSVETWTQVP